MREVAESRATNQKQAGETSTAAIGIIGSREASTIAPLPPPLHPSFPSVNASDPARDPSLKQRSPCPFQQRRRQGSPPTKSGMEGLPALQDQEDPVRWGKSMFLLCHPFQGMSLYVFSGVGREGRWCTS